MKITAKQYAKSLYEATKGKSQGEISGIVENFARILVKNNQIKNVENIISKFGEIYNKENRIVEAEVTSREKLNGELRSMLRNKVSDKYQAKEVVIENKIDKEIKGGIIIKVGDEVMDASVARQMKELKNNLIK